MLNAQSHRKGPSGLSIHSRRVQDQDKDAEEPQSSEEKQGRYPERNAWTGGWAGLRVQHCLHGHVLRTIMLCIC
jgi:hypothetical protein